MVSGLARVEGEGALRVTVRDGQVEQAELNIYEPPRFFEAFLRGRSLHRAAGHHVPDLRDLPGRLPDQRLQRDRAGLRRRARPAAGGTAAAAVLRGMDLQPCPAHLPAARPRFPRLPRRDRSGPRAPRHRRTRAGAEKGRQRPDGVPGRPGHPPGQRAGRRVLPRSQPRRDSRRSPSSCAARSTWPWRQPGGWPPSTSPTWNSTTTCSPSTIPAATPSNGGTLATTGGLSFTASEFPGHVTEQQVPHSTALHATLDGHHYLTGPLARYSLNSGYLSPAARQAAADAGLGAQCRNPFRSVVVRAVEIVYAVEEALRIIDGYQRPDRPAVEVTPRAGTGHGVSEAPRGLLYHRYELDADGLIRSATIIPPTSQNQAAIEDDLRRVIAANLDLDDASLTALCERAIRNHDPCISCAAHFLTLTVCRGDHRAVVIGVGNPFRRDDGIGPAAAAEIERQHLPGVRVVISDGEPAGLLEAWAGVDLAIVVDAIRWVPAYARPHPPLAAGQLERGGTGQFPWVRHPGRAAARRCAERASPAIW